jgi:hypothetical protein
MLMKRVLASGLLLVSVSAGLAQAPEPLCVIDQARMPKSWQPPSELKRSLNPAPWSQSEEKDAAYSVERGLDEMIDHFKRKPAAIESLWGDSIEPLMQVTYASANPPALDAKARETARSNLTHLIDLTVKRMPDPKQAPCDDRDRLLPLAIFAHELYPADDPRTAQIVQRTNAASRACGSLEAAMGYDPRKILADKQASPERLLNVYIWALWFLEAEAHPAIELSAEARALGPQLWTYFGTYKLSAAREFEEGPWDDKFVAIADIAPHIVHLLTGTNRFPLYVEDSPALYRFHRENFYAVMQVNELDLFASFVDTLRQYGCTPENDIQVRDGTRYLLRLFHQGNDRWMAFRQDGETDATIDDYGLVHYPWTAILGVRTRRLEHPDPIVHGDLTSRWLPHRQRKN